MKCVEINFVHQGLGYEIGHADTIRISLALARQITHDDSFDFRAFRFSADERHQYPADDLGIKAGSTDVFPHLIDDQHVHVLER